MKRSKTVRKSLLAAMVALSGVLAAKADWMYWLVSQKSGGSDSVTFTYASMASFNEEESSWYYYSDGANDSFVSSDGLSLDEKAVAKLGAPTASSQYLGYDGFYIALYDDGYDLVGMSGKITFASIRDSINSGEIKPGEVPSGNVVMISSFHAVPEPTGGTLMLMGLAMLALRRKKDRVFTGRSDRR